MEFLNEFEKNLVFLEDVENFRMGNAYNNFVGRWNLAVYYQIRFREIALPVEVSMDTEEFLILSEASNSAILNEIGSRNEAVRFRLASTNTVVSALAKCWNPSIFLSAVVHRFWKLTLQIIARYGAAVEKAVSFICTEDTSNLNDESGKQMMDVPVVNSLLGVGDDHSLNINRSDVNRTLASAQKGHTRSASDQNIGTNDGADKDEQFQKIKRETQKESLVLVFLDITDICEHLKKVFFADTVLPLITDLDESMKQNLNSSLIEGCDSILQQQEELTVSIVVNVASKSIPQLKSVGDIQRLYRRTNRQVPSKPCPYIVSVLLPIQEFYTTTTAICPQDILHNWVILILSEVAKAYFEVVSETLAAVQKMEESLRRLKKVREKTASAAGDKAQEGPGLNKISDDDKIRLQLYVDVKHFILQIQKGLHVESKEIKFILELENLVVEATKSCFDDYISKVGNITS